MTADLLQQGGGVLVAIFALSMLGWTLIVWKWLELREQTRPGLAWADRAIGKLQHHGAAAIEQVRAICGAHRNGVARLMLAALATGEPQRRDFERHLKPLFEAEAVRLRHHMGLIAAIAACCPLLGLLGTVVGMVRTFEALGGIGGAQTEQLAAGIGQALITTQAGLVVALPLLLVHRYLSAKIQRHVDRAALCVKKIETLLCRDESHKAAAEGHVALQGERTHV